jgi:hypothetical protein
MEKPKVLEVNCQTGEETVREMTDEEYAQFLKDQPTEE